MYINHINPPLPPFNSPSDPYGISIQSSFPLYFLLLLLIALSQISDALRSWVCGHPLRHELLTVATSPKRSDSLLQQRAAASSSSNKGRGLKGPYWISTGILAVTFLYRSYTVHCNYLDLK